MGIPYVRSKMQDLYERLGGGLDPEMMTEGQGDNMYRVRPALRGPTTTNPRSSAKITPRRRIGIILSWMFKALYPWVNLAYEVGTVGYDIAFAFGRTRWWRWWMALVGVEVVRSGAGDGSPGVLGSWLVSVFPWERDSR